MGFWLGPLTLPRFQHHEGVASKVCFHVKVFQISSLLSTLPLIFYPQVVRAAEETSATLANSIAPDQCVRVLCPIIQTAEVPINQAAIKMLTKVC